MKTASFSHLYYAQLKLLISLGPDAGAYFLIYAPCRDLQEPAGAAGCCVQGSASFVGAGPRSADHRQVRAVEGEARRRLRNAADLTLTDVLMTGRPIAADD